MVSTHEEDATRLAGLVEMWHDEADSCVALLTSLPDSAWTVPTDLPGWDVRAVAAHMAHLESELAGNPQPQVEVPDAPHITGLMGQFTEIGPVARAQWPVHDIIEELRSSVAARYDALRQNPPSDPAAPGPGFAALIGWSWEALLSNRPLDLWMHEQDIRRAVGMPGNLDSPAAAHAIDTFGRALAFVLGKKVRPPAGSTVVVEITGELARTFAAELRPDGRGAMLSAPPEHPSARLVLDSETFVLAAGGRRAPDDLAVASHGDEELARAVLERLAVTP